jgi:hypothetical protein
LSLPPHNATGGRFWVETGGKLICGQQARIELCYEAGENGLAAGSRLRFGLPNTGWDRPVVPQQRYWDELVTGDSRRLAPFHPVNTTPSVESARKVHCVLEVVERMLVPDEDPAFAYWRWWITLTVEGEDLEPGGRIRVLYGDQRFGVATRIQTFPEPAINVTAYSQPAGESAFHAISGSPHYFDVLSGPASRANVIVSSVDDKPRTARLALTDECHCMPEASTPVSLTFDGDAVFLHSGASTTLPLNGQGMLLGNDSVWGKSNPSVAGDASGLQLFWGDLHAQSEHHVMHSQKKDFRQEGWSKGISCGTLEECYHYGREVSLLDFVAITDQGACLTNKWEYCQEQAGRFHEDGRFVVFRGYEAGSPLGHRNVIFSTGTIEAPLDPVRFNSFHPEVVFQHYRDRDDVLIIPHHVKTWTNWDYHDPRLEPLMEIYSCWGQSESPGLDLWNKGQTPGAGAWEAFHRGYRMGLIASSDNHVGMPGRSYPGDRQIHTPFAGGLCAIWAEALTRESLFAALRARRCYGTTGARIVMRFSIGGVPMGASVPGPEPLQGHLEIAGTGEFRSVELLRDLVPFRSFACSGDRLQTDFKVPAGPGVYYVRMYQMDGQRAWTSPIWVE